MEPILEIRNLTKEFKDFKLNNINLKMDKGYVMGFIGPNGAGKSTTIKLILNLLKRDSGSVKVLGLDNIKDENKIKDKIGFILDENYYYDELNINEIKKIISSYYTKWDDNTFNKYIKDFNLPRNKKIKNLSKGMKMKFSLAIALSHDAELLIMDEPTSGLDPIVRNELLEILYEVIQDENKGVFFSTHITSDLDKIADYITFIKDGEIVFSEAKDDIIENYGLIKGSNDLLNNEVRKEFIGLKESKFGFEGLIKDKYKIKKLFNDDVIVERPSLEEIMLYFTRRSINV
ncbi:ABC transporter ATP-binding protein [Clostridium sp. D2Q-11]|uniref:ABC transporter ATP-binding protein n=1 Tax=Anaeromonas frigoriresistens TaxID=2683708 RepID=A0A942UT46_9FIRM|nr:ABC transporter ATP-binding protein [Anaeromonas frigoriresistens]MBS4537480.1 ABC transporter ATP-binding protein [Anaeromonas frigoriresistens]